MADIKFSCPHCQQHIQAGPDYAGLEIGCPSCNGRLIVPGTPATAPAPQPAARTARKHLTLRSAGESAAPAPEAPTEAAAEACPSCDSPLAPGAVLCTSCGYNRNTGRRMTPGRPTPAAKRAPSSGEAPWYATPWPYVGAVVLVMGILYFLGRSNPGMMLAFVGVAALYVLTVHIMVIVAAFRQSVGMGFLTLCVPFVAIYFVFKVSENDTLKVLYGFAILLNIGLRFLPDVGE